MAVKTYSLKTDGNKQLSKNFQVREFRCKDGSDKILIDDSLVANLQKIRDYFGKPINITSAYRNATHNRNVGGASNSQHLLGTAADIHIVGVAPTLIAQYAQFIGMKGIGDYDNASGYFVHVDMRSGNKVFWKQKNKRYVGVSTHGGQEQFKGADKVEIRDLKIKDLNSGKTITVKAGLQDNENYVRLRDLPSIASGLVIGYDNAAKMPTVKGSGDADTIRDQLIGKLEELVRNLRTGT